MYPLVVVVSQIFFDAAIDGCDIIRQSIQIFFLEGAVEPFDMGIVIRLADPRVAVFLFHLLNKPCADLRAVVGLEHVEWEGSRSLHFSDKRNGCRAVHRGIRFGIRPPGTDIEQYENIQTLFLVDHPVDGVDLHKIAWIHGQWALRRRMIPLPGTTLLHEAGTVDGLCSAKIPYGKESLPESH